jgi:hypothetical protein
MLWETPNRTYINENNQSISVNQDNHKAARTMMFVMRSFRDDEGNLQHMVEPAWRMMKRIKGRE